MREEVSMINYTDFNSPQTPKGSDVYWVSKILHSRGLLKEVFVRGNAGSEYDEYVETPIPLANFIPRVFTAIKYYLTDRFPGRDISQAWLDRLTAKRLSQTDVLIAGIPGFPRTMRAAKGMGAKTVLKASVPHSKTGERVKKEEYNRWNIDKKVCPSSAYEESFELADYILAYSSFVKESLIENGISNEKIYLTGNGADISRYRPDNSKKTENFEVLFLASISIRKGLQYLLQAWKELNLKDANLIVAGRIHDEVEQIVNRFSELQNVNYVGHVDPLEYMQRADIYILPSLLEGMPKSVIEAMACATPVITFENTGSPVRNGKDGFILPNRDIDGLREKITYFYNNPEQKKVMGENARDRANQYSREAYANRVVDCVEKVLQNDG